MSDDEYEELTEAEYDAIRKAYWDGAFENDEEEDRKEFEALCVKARAKVEQAMQSACLKDPSVAALRAHGEWAYTESLAIMAVGADDVIINPYIVMDTDLARIEIILRHEWGHVARGHHDREKAFVTEINDPDNAKIWKTAFNAGADMEVNSGLIAEIVAANLADECYVPGYRTCRSLPGQPAPDQRPDQLRPAWRWRRAEGCRVLPVL